jgi:c-di-GMP-binding flagellar brake protein YcgR
VKILSDNEVVFLIKDSKIELRKYPRLDTSGLIIKVNTNGLTGLLKDISLGGCKVHFPNGFTPDYYNSSILKELFFILPDGEKIKVRGKIVNVDGAHKNISYSFTAGDGNVFRVYKKITKLLKELE